LIELLDLFLPFVYRLQMQFPWNIALKDLDLCLQAGQKLIC
jgi:hypothetical protein